MAIVVENGTGMADAESYLSVAAFKDYCDKWGYAYGTTTDAVIEQKLRQATNFIDTIFRYKGTRLLASQALEYPRDGLTDWSGFDITGVPQRVAKATAELAFKALTESLYTDLDRGGMVTSESVGPLSVSYADGAPVGKVYRFAENLLKPYIRTSGDFENPVFFGTSESPDFERGMFDNPGTGSFTDTTE